MCKRRMYVCERRMYVCERARMNYVLYGPSYKALVHPSHMMCTTDKQPEDQQTPTTETLAQHSRQKIK